MEVLGVDVLSIRSHDADRLDRILVGAHKVTDVDERAEVRVSDRVDELFNARRVLREVAVIFGHRADAFLLGVLRDLERALREIGQSVVIADGIFASREAVADVVAHILRAHSGGEVYLLLHTLDLGVKVGGEEVCAYTVGHDLKSALGAALLDLFRDSEVEVVRPAALGELDSLESHFGGVVDNAHKTELVLVDVLTVAVGCD